MKNIKSKILEAFKKEHELLLKNNGKIHLIGNAKVVETLKNVLENYNKPNGFKD